MSRGWVLLARWASALSHVGRLEIELTGDEVDDRGEVAEGAVAACLCFRGLHEAVDAFEQPIRDPRYEPAEDR